MKKYTFIINPTAGNVDPVTLIPLIKDISSNYNHKIELKLTEYHRHAIELAAEIEDDEIVVSVGGDGTLNEVINGLNIDKNVTIGLLPSGSGNDFKNNIKLSNSIEENINYFFNDSYNSMKVDVGTFTYRVEGDINKYNNMRFINSLGIGFDAYTAFLKNKSNILTGIMSYLISVLRALIKYESININFAFEEQSITGNKLLIAVGNGKTTGGGFYLTKDAEIDDGLLDVCIIDFVSRKRLLTKLPLAIKKRIDEVPEVLSTRIKSAKLTLMKPYYVHADGELISDKISEIEISVLKNKLNFITF